jgi:polyhydroxybutyrate depolymerase
MQRDYFEHLPAQHQSSPPLILILHGGDSNATSTETNSGFDALGDQQGFVAVYPDGYKKSWADGRGKVPADQAGIDDVAFLVAVIAEVQSRDGTDPKRTFLTGISNGGFMDLTFACQRSDLVAAVAPNAGSMGTSVAPTCTPSRPLSVMNIHGTADPVVPYDGGQMTGQGGVTTIISSQQVLTSWAAWNRCAAIGTTQPQPQTVQDGTSLTITRASGCPIGISVELWTVVGGGHTWPGGQQYLPIAAIGPVSHQFSAPSAIWQFFASHGR